ncbi:MAG: gamma-glutamyltransferase [Rhodospirillaceae bacterium]|jgi:gamma-glutamyltranspeptidase / glutathione hydrolase|nr:gamma-glutamyltransferase [Rhodospirillaceae bacterium]
MWAFAAAPASGQQNQPEDSTGRSDNRLVTANRHMVAAAHPDAVAAGLEMLRRGGSAADAAIAVQLVLNLVEPQSSGIGGGAFLLFHDAQKNRTVAFDGRETAPIAATPDMFLTADGTPMKFSAALVGGRSVGTPGTVALLARVFQEHGKLTWPELFAPAVRLAQQGFIVGPRLAKMLASERGQRLRTYAAARDYFFPGGKPLQSGTRKTNPQFAETLIAIAERGPRAFYSGAIAEDIVAAVRNAPGNPGRLSLADLASYDIVRRDPVCHGYRSYRICGMGPPSSGGLTVGLTLGMLTAFDLHSMGPDDPQSWHLLAEASKLAFADRNQYMADGDFVPVPEAGLLHRDYIAKRATLIRRETSILAPVVHGLPPGTATPKRAPDNQKGRPGTSHISIVDGSGNAVSMTTTIEGAFGSQLMVRGFLLNNELTDFSFLPNKDGQPVANRAAPRKRPRSSMAPTIVFNADNSLRLVVGSPGGSRIIGYVAKTLVAVLDWDLDIQKAIDLGHVVNRNGATDFEAGTAAEKFVPALKALGHKTRIRDLNSGLHGIEIVAGKLRGGADPRREGVARGD